MSESSCRLPYIHMLPLSCTTNKIAIVYFFALQIIQIMQTLPKILNCFIEIKGAVQYHKTVFLTVCCHTKLVCVWKRKQETDYRDRF